MLQNKPRPVGSLTVCDVGHEPAKLGEPPQHLLDGQWIRVQDGPSNLGCSADAGVREELKLHTQIIQYLMDFRQP
jgi:hypothetical protein